MAAALGWAYGILIVGYFAGFLASMWRLRKLRESTAWNLEGLALVALIAGWPTGWPVQSQLRRHERDVASLVTSHTRPLLVAFTAIFVPFMAVVLIPTSDWKDWAAVPLGLAALAVACWTWLRDVHRRPHDA